MASSRKWSPADQRCAKVAAHCSSEDVVDIAGGSPMAASERVLASVRAALARHAADAGSVAVALSGGRDSVALLDAVMSSAAPRVAVCAIHVHHGLSAHADAWAGFCATLCAARGTELVVRRVVVPRAHRTSLEAEARRLRYAALADAARALDAGVVLLAHHQDDQAETLLLQLLRGAGPHGLAAMPPVRVEGGLRWVRPLLGVARADIDIFVRARALAWIDDDSNDDPRFARNALRRDVIPSLRALSPGYPATLARAARLQVDACALADDLAAFDAANAFDGATLERDALVALPPHRARNALRWFLRQRGLPPPPESRLEAMVRQLVHARPDAQIRLAHAGREIGVHRGRIAVHAAAAPPFECAWQGEDVLALPHGMLGFVRARGAGIALRHLASGGVVVRTRRGGERIQLAANRPQRSVKALLQEQGVPAWSRDGLPFVFCGDRLAAVPRIGVDRRFAATAGDEGLTLDWQER